MNKQEAGYYLEDVSKWYDVETCRHIVFEQLNLFIPAEKITVLLGKSGSGKTTLLRLLAGIEAPSKGKVYYKEKGEEIEPQVGVVFQESRLMPWLTVEENIKLPIRMRPNQDQTIKYYLELMGLEKFRKSYPIELSGGMAQRVSIARALAYKPHFMMLDEPFSALDYFTRLTMQEELIKVYQATRKGMLFVTHNIEEALMLGHEILIMRHGASIEKVTIPYTYQERDLTNPFFVEMKKQILGLF